MTFTKNATGLQNLVIVTFPKTYIQAFLQLTLALSPTLRGICHCPHDCLKEGLQGIEVVPMEGYFLSDPMKLPAK